MKKPTVWVIKEQTVRTGTGSEPIDYTPAYEFGDVTFITQSDLALHPNSTITKAWIRDVLDFCKKIDTGNDYIVLTGQPLAIFMIGALMAGLEKCPRILVWRREQGRYVVFDPLAVLEAAAADVTPA